MNKFQALFGIEQKKIRKNILLLPFVPAKTLEIFGLKTLSNGRPFAAASTDTLSIIRTNIGASFVGDAVMYMKDSPAENIFLLGSCGLFNKKFGSHIGSLVTPTTVYGLESFSDIITHRLQPASPVHPDGELLRSFIETTKLNLVSTTCVSFGSLYFESTHAHAFDRLNADVIEMECSALFHAAKETGKRAMALLYITDILGEKAFYNEPAPSDKKSLTDAISQACHAVDLFSKKNA